MMKATISSFSAIPCGKLAVLESETEEKKERKKDLFKLCEKNFESLSVILGPEGIVEGQREGKDDHGCCCGVGKAWLTLQSQRQIILKSSKAMIIGLV